MSSVSLPDNCRKIELVTVSDEVFVPASRMSVADPVTTTLWSTVNDELGSVTRKARFALRAAELRTVTSWPSSTPDPSAVLPEM